jgi:2-dehydropantoate 2-reductase
MTAFVAGLELSGWSFRAYRRSPWLGRAAGGAREAILTQLSRPNIFTRALLRLLLSSAGFYVISLLIPFLFPFDLEKYLKFHYLKTRAQTRTLLELFIGDGIARGIQVKNLQTLLQGMNASE